MEALEIDDQTFFPCGCGYQVYLQFGISIVSLSVISRIYELFSNFENISSMKISYQLQEINLTSCLIFCIFFRFVDSVGIVSERMTTGFVQHAEG